LKRLQTTGGSDGSDGSMIWFADKDCGSCESADDWRAKMIADQLETRGITDPRLLEAFRQVPRHLFCPDAELAEAYGDHPVEIGFCQTVSQPYMIAWMLQEARLKPDDHVLEIGTGSGYQTALLSRLAAQIFSVECIPELLAAARARMEEVEVVNAELLAGDGSVGWPERAPFDVIIYSAGAPAVPDVVKRQLAVRGRLLAPVGSRMSQTLVCIERVAGEEFRQKDLGGCVFVPLRGAYGWSD
jgi:protein-L-isoaspartate(D-aspartate) O-methyltransferase